MDTRPAIGQAFSILATAFLASMAVSSFFFVKPGDAMASGSTCQSQGVLSDGASESQVILTVSLSKGCLNAPEGVLRGVDERGISHLVEKSVIAESDEGYISVAEFSLNSEFEYYTFEIGKYFYAEVAAK